MPQRGVEFPPPYGKELPLPSDAILDSNGILVIKLQLLWMVVWQEPKKERELQRVLINRFFGSLSESQVNWLEGNDPKWKNKSRAVLVKERAIHLCQTGDTDILKEEKNQGVIEGFRTWIKEAKASQTTNP